MKPERLYGIPLIREQGLVNIKTWKIKYNCCKFKSALLLDRTKRDG